MQCLILRLIISKMSKRTPAFIEDSDEELREDVRYLYQIASITFEATLILPPTLTVLNLIDARSIIIICGQRARTHSACNNDWPIALCRGDSTAG